jgi:lipocalin
MAILTRVSHQIWPRQTGISNCRWEGLLIVVDQGMQFIWPIEAEYIIAYLDENYQNTIIARNNRDYVWIMSRTKSISDEDKMLLIKRVEDMGYDIKELRIVPHSR